MPERVICTPDMAAAPLGQARGPGCWLSSKDHVTVRLKQLYLGVMTPRAVDWGAAGRDEAAGPEGLRERKKRRLRQRLSDTATAMFLERGFDAVRVVEVAAACEVSEKTVYNYFPTKESLVLDRWDTTMAALRAGLADPELSPVEAVLGILADELGALTRWLSEQPDLGAATVSIRRFGEMIATTPALRAYQSTVLDDLTAAAARALADRAGVSPDEPEPQIAAIALLGLWSVHFRALDKYLSSAPGPAELQEAVTADVERAARLIAGGLQPG
jgi:AcrR family transcriptional regulator